MGREPRATVPGSPQLAGASEAGPGTGHTPMTLAERRWGVSGWHLLSGSTWNLCPCHTPCALTLGPAQPVSYRVATRGRGWWLHASPPPRPTPRGANSSPCLPDSPPGLRLTTLTLLKALVGCLSSVPQTVSGACHQCPGGDARGGHPGMGVCREVSTLGPRPWMPGALQVLSARRPWFHVVSTSTFPPSSWVSSLRAAPLPSSPTGPFFVYVSGPQKFTSPCGSRRGHAIIHLVGQTVWLRSPGAPLATRLYVELSPVVPGLGSGFI